MSKLHNVVQEIILMKREWQELFESTIRVKLDEWFCSLPMHDTLRDSSQLIKSNIVKISSRGNVARLKLGRILVRLFASVLNKNMAAFEAAFKDLIELGRSV